MRKRNAKPATWTSPSHNMLLPSRTWKVCPSFLWGASKSMHKKLLKLCAEFNIKLTYKIRPPFL